MTMINRPIRNRKLNKSVDLAHIDKLARKQGPLALKREGRIRELANVTDIENAIIENEMVSLKETGGPREVGLIDKQTMSRGGARYYTSRKIDYDTIRK